MSTEKSKKTKKNDVKETPQPPDEVISQETDVKETKESDRILDDVVETQEKVTDDVIERLDEMSDKDTAGQIFNPDIHAVGRDHKPSITSSGKYRLKKRGKETVTDDDLQRKTVSETSAALFVQGGVTLFGDEWLPNEKSKELDGLVLAFDNYYKTAGIVYIPPSLALVIALSGYSIKRMSKPETKSRLGKAKDVIKKRILKIFKK